MLTRGQSGKRRRHEPVHSRLGANGHALRLGNWERVRESGVPDVQCGQVPHRPQPPGRARRSRCTTTARPCCLTPGSTPTPTTAMRRVLPRHPAHNTVVVDGHNQEEGRRVRGAADSTKRHDLAVGQQQPVRRRRPPAHADDDRQEPFSGDRPPALSARPTPISRCSTCSRVPSFSRDGLTVAATDSSPSHTLRITQLDPARPAFRPASGAITRRAACARPATKSPSAATRLPTRSTARSASYTTLLSVGRPDRIFKSRTTAREAH